MIPSYNTQHLVQRLQRLGAVLHGDEWLLPSAHAFELISSHITFTHSQLEKKFCPGCGKEKPLPSFAAQDDAPDGRSRMCNECIQRESRESRENSREGAHWDDARNRRFPGTPVEPPADRGVIDELTASHRVFPGSMALANALLWWEQVDVPAGSHLFPHNYFPLDLMHQIVEGTGFSWSRHLEVMKQIIVRGYHKHVQNCKGVGYRIATNLLHDGLEAVKLHDVVRTFSFSIFRRLEEAWEMYPEAPDEAVDIMRRVFAMSQSQIDTLTTWAATFHRSFFYLRQHVGAGGRRILEPISITNAAMEHDLDEIFQRAAESFRRWGSTIGYDVDVTRRNDG